MTATRLETLCEEHNGLRLDKALSLLFPEHTRSAFARLIETGHVTVDGMTARKVSATVSSGQQIGVDFPPPAPTTAESQDLPVTILFQNEDLAVIDKPAGLVVHPAAGHPDHTLVNALLFHIDDLSGIGGSLRPGIVHRLDRDTSGIMVIAKNDFAHHALTSAWGTDAVRKEYLALIWGHPPKEHGTINAPIARDPRDRKRMAIVSGGRNAVTDYAFAERFRYVSLLRCRIHTGRTHQIRVHLKHLGHPIIGDPLYSGPQWRGIPDKRVQKLLSSFPRQALHAASITFPNPRTGEAMTFEAPLPSDFATLLEELRKDV